jgi:signal recognition particle receptor subunit beta
MDTLDIRFKRIADAIRTLPEDEREDALRRVEMEVFVTESDSDSLLTAEQIAEAERRMALPTEIVPRERVEALFTKYGHKT